tara:strand:+ start:1416 stop:2315 length:900 start_codon:yes stop_codon:yes gene_type:complete
VYILFPGVHEIKNIKGINMIEKKNGLFIVSTPIGNLEDISNRAIKTIKEADIVFCENPGHSIKLLNKFGIKKKLIGLHDYNELSIISEYKDKFRKNIIVLISDSGSPLISDPGYKLVRHFLTNGIFVTTVPGATSIIPALQLSSFPLNEFYFAGFFPKTDKSITDFLKKIYSINVGVVFFVSSHKILNCIKLLEKTSIDRRITIVKEITKINESVLTGYPSEIVKKIKEQNFVLKGEFVIVLEPSGQKKVKNDIEDIYDKEILKLLTNFSLTDVVQIVHNLTNIKKTEIYRKALKLKND